MELFAFRNLGHTTVALSASDPESKALQFIRTNHTYEQVLPDIRQTPSWSSRSPIDVYVGCTPCQLHSMAGSRLGAADPEGCGDLLSATVDDIQRARPKVFLLENVHGLLLVNQGHDFAELMDRLGSLHEYAVDWRC